MVKGRDAVNVRAIAPALTSSRSEAESRKRKASLPT